MTALETAPTSAAATLNVLPAAEREQVLDTWATSAMTSRDEYCVHELFEAQVARAPDAIAVVDASAAVTYRALNARANQLAAHLRAGGVTQEARVVICIERSFDFVVALLAVLKAGAAYVPVDPAFPASRVRTIVADCAAAAVLTHGQRLDALVDAFGGVPVVDLTDVSLWRSAATANRRDVDVQPAQVACVMYTSGSTGQPKGVMVPHRAIPRIARDNGYAEFGPDDRMLFESNPAFDAVTLEVWPPLLTGGCVVIIATAVVLEPVRFAAALIQQQITTAWLTVGLFNRYAEPLRAVWPRFRCLMVGGDALDPAVIRRVCADAPPQQFLNGYGPTETTVFASTHAIETVDVHATGVPIGRPIADTRVLVLTDTLQPAPVGVVGEIYVAGRGLARGYLAQPARTAERFVADPYGPPGTRLYRTGDRARWRPDGRLEFAGRADFQVKVRGFRIELGEIEAALTQHAGVREAVVIAPSDATGDKRLIAYYRAVTDADVPADALRAHLRTTLPDFMVPAAYVRVADWPLTPNGKVDRRGLPAPDRDAMAILGYAPPVGLFEEALAGIWADVLRVDRVGRHDDFFALGGHSLAALRVISRLRQVLNVDVTISALFERPVLADLAAVVAQTGRSALPPLTVQERGARIPLSFAQQRLWVLAKMGVSAPYHISWTIEINGPLDRSALRRALDRIVARHEALRTTFAVDGDPWQYIASADASRFVLREEDLRGHANPSSALADSLTAEFRRPFDLETGPLLRGLLIALADQAHVLAITIHHIVSDGWSMGVWRQELRALYDAFARGADDPSPALPLQYADYAIWQRAWLTGDRIAEHAKYWTTTLLGAPAQLTLPADRLRPAQQGYAGAASEVVLDASLTAGLIALGQRHGITLYMTLLAAWAALLVRLSGQDEVVVGSPVSNRNDVAAEGLIGFFVNTLALRVDMSRPLTVAQLLAQVKAQVLAAQAHSDLPFEQVVELVRPVRSVAHHPLFQSMFTWQQGEGNETFELPGLTVRPAAWQPPYLAKFDVTLALQLTGDRIIGSAGYASALFDSATVERWLGYLRQLLQEMIVDDTQVVARVPLLSATERALLVGGWNVDGSAAAHRPCVHERFEAQVARTPDAVAVIRDSEVVSYAALNARANRLAHYLRALRVGPDVRVAIALERSPDLLVAILGVLKAGGAYVPLDPAYPPARLRSITADSSAAVLITQGPLLSRVVGFDTSSRIVDLDDVTAWDSYPDSNVGCRLAPEHVAYLVYTSGSTGRPKGVMVAHGSLSNYLQWAAATYYAEEEGGSPILHSVGFDGIVTTLFGPLITGQALTLLPPGDEIAALVSARAAGRRPYALIKMTPSHLQLLNRALAKRETPAPTKALMIGGEAVAAADLVEWHARFPEVRLINHFGPTETTVGCSTFEIPVPLDDAAGVPIGRPVANTRLYILDAQGALAPAGVAGELYVAGVQVARGYHERPGQTAEPVRSGSIWRARVAHVSHGRSGAPPSRRRHRVPRTSGLPGEDPRLPHRAWRDRSAARRAPWRARSRRGGRPELRWRTAPGGVLHDDAGDVRDQRRCVA